MENSNGCHDFLCYCMDFYICRANQLLKRASIFLALKLVRVWDCPAMQYKLFLVSRIKVHAVIRKLQKISSKRQIFTRLVLLLFYGNQLKCVFQEVIFKLFILHYLSLYQITILAKCGAIQTGDGQLTLSKFTQ